MKTPPPPARQLKDSAHDRVLSRERIAADLVAFEQAGGHIEVLGTTRWHNGGKSTLSLAEEKAVAGRAPQPRLEPAS
jgi:hypothetical protein